ncbi:MAG: cytochrome c biogenesis protein CcsA [Candidatus Marinimicrobia bacterium]|nr:cytochrome c biogenesis protein CcsA [Candidatus Neomarinimicrobiota bacterium]MCF7830004.1 cytochrome c biogenesis protein CcsA [Candidatus Neomarinimicrobiota bacterium]MCF7881954.1 cytochrome c biogenesis protein CcsA [Candidatus Neomarinimicrobiota bacterium]
MSAIAVLHIVSLGCYWISLIQFWRYFRSRDSRTARIATLGVWLGLISQTLMLVLFTLRRGNLPLAQFAEAATAFVWILTIMYLVQQYLLQEQEFGVFVMGVVALVQTISVLVIDYTHPLAESLQNVMFEIHVVSMLFGYAGFTLGFIAALMYLLLFNDIHGHRFGLFYSRLPSLEFLDKLNVRSVLIGLVFLTMGIGLGMMNAGTAWGFFWEWDPKLTVVFLNWLIYCYFAVSYLFFGWRGQRTANLSIIGFVVVLISFFIVTNFTSTIHTF